jgi:hypothetical protein
MLPAMREETHCRAGQQARDTPFPASEVFPSFEPMTYLKALNR